MRAFMPRANAAPVDKNTGLWTPVWFRFFRDFWAGLGWDNSTPVYREITVGGLQMPVVNGSATPSLFGAGWAMSMPAGSTSQIAATFRLPPDYKSGTDITPFVEWAQNGSGTGTARLAITRSPAAVGEVAVAGVETIVDDVSGTDEEVQRTEYEAVDGEALKRGTNISLILTRVGGSDTFTGAVLALNVGFKYRAEGFATQEVFP